MRLLGAHASAVVAVGYREFLRACGRPRGGGVAEAAGKLLYMLALHLTMSAAVRDLASRVPPPPPSSELGPVNVSRPPE